MDQGKFQFEGLRWIQEMELLNSPQLINHIKMNILLCSRRIQETELLISSENKQMLVYLQLSWFGRKFFKKTIFDDVEDVLNQILPSFQFRVIDDPKLFHKALEKVKQALTKGPKNEERNTDAQSAASKPADGTKSDDKTINAIDTTKSVVSNSEKQSKN